MNRKLKLYWLKFRKNMFVWNKDNTKVVGVVMILLCMLQYIIPSPFDSGEPSTISLLVRVAMSILTLIGFVYAIVKLPKIGIGYLQFALSIVYYHFVMFLLKTFAPSVETISVMFSMSLATIALCFHYYNKGYATALRNTMMAYVIHRLGKE